MLTTKRIIAFFSHCRGCTDTEAVIEHPRFPGIECLSDPEQILPDEITEGEQIATGGEAVIYKVRWGEKVVAEKINENVFNAMIEAKIHYWAAQQMDCVVPLYGYVRQADSVSLVMKFYPEQDLQSFIGFYEAQEWSARLDMTYQIVSIVAKLHDVGVAHRDIKPENFFVERNPSGGIKINIGDFGCANSSGLCGTISYMAPEYLQADEDKKICIENLDPFAADIFALARTMLYVMQWQKPQKIAPGDSIRGVRPNISKELEDQFPKVAYYIRWGWAQNPSVRPDAQEMAAGIGKVMDFRR